MFYLTVLTKRMLKPAAFNYKELISRSYDRIMVRLSKNKSEKSRLRAKFILEIITSATRALHSHEIQGALSIRVDNQTIDFNRRRSVVPLEDVCGPIIEVHSNGVIDMIHPTAKRSVGILEKLVNEELTLAVICCSTTVDIISTFNAQISQWRDSASPTSRFRASSLLYQMQRFRSIREQAITRSKNMQLVTGSIMWNLPWIYWQKMPMKRDDLSKPPSIGCGSSIFNTATLTMMRQRMSIL